MRVKWLGEACVEINGAQNILIDPHYQEAPKENPDLILITHEHDDHFDPQVLEDYPEAEVYAPQSVYEKFEVSGTVVSGGEEIGPGIKVLDCNCYGAEEAVSYYYQGILHTADASQFPDPKEEVKLVFSACFADLIDDYMESCRRIEPEMVVLYHYTAGDEEAIKEANEVKTKLKEAGFNTQLLSLGQSIQISN